MNNIFTPKQVLNIQASSAIRRILCLLKWISDFLVLHGWGSLTLLVFIHAFGVTGSKSCLLTQVLSKACFVVLHLTEWVNGLLSIFTSVHFDIAIFVCKLLFISANLFNNFARLFLLIFFLSITVFFWSLSRFSSVLSSDLISGFAGPL